MRDIAWLLSAAALSATGAAAQTADLACKPESGARLDVRVTGVQSDSGLVAVSLYGDDPKKFLKHNGSIGTVRVSAKSPTTHVCIAVPKDGRYALAVYHDVNGDRKLNLNLFWPAEPFALSNNPPPHFAWPPLAASLFSVHDGDNAITVSLKDPKDVKEAQSKGQ